MNPWVIDIWFSYPLINIINSERICNSQFNLLFHFLNYNIHNQKSKITLYLPYWMTDLDIKIIKSQISYKANGKISIKPRKDKNLIFPLSSQLCRPLYVSEISLQFYLKRIISPTFSFPDILRWLTLLCSNLFTWPETKNNSSSSNLQLTHAEYLSFYSDKFHP